MTNPDKGFVHMKLSLLEGRSEELKRIIKESVLSFLTEEFQELFSPVACSISIEIQDIPKGFYDQKEI